MRGFTLVRKNVTRRKLRTALLFFSIAVAFFLFAILATFHNVSTSGTQDAASDRLIVSNDVSFTQTLPLKYGEQISGTEGVGPVTHRTWFGGYYREPQNFIVTYAVQPESFFDVFAGTGASAEEVSTFQSRRNGILLGSAIAETYGISVGDRLPLFSTTYSRKDGSKSWDFEVVGLMTSTENQIQNTALIQYGYLDEGRTFGNSSVSQFVLQPDGTVPLDTLTGAIDGQFRNSVAETQTQTEAQFNQAFLAQIGDISLIFLLVSGAAFLSLLMIVGSTMVTAVRERTHEIAVQYAIGATKVAVARQVFFEALLVVAVGGGAGLLLASGFLSASRAASGGQIDHIVMSGSIWGWGAVIIVAFAALVAAIPMSMIARMNVAAALKRA